MTNPSEQITAAIKEMRETDAYFYQEVSGRIDDICVAMEVLVSAIENKAFCNCQQEIARGVNVRKVCWGCEALQKAAEILKGRG